MTRIQQQLFALQDLKYKDFHTKLIPNVSPDTVIGVRMPMLRSLAKDLSKNIDLNVFLQTLPHTYYEENNLHGLLICSGHNYEKTIDEIDRFLPYVDNWATCDLLRPRVFYDMVRIDHVRLLSDIHRWIDSDMPFTIRFGIEMLMTFFLDFQPVSSEDLLRECLDQVACITNDDYYVHMMVAWFFATALAKQYAMTLPYIEHRVLPPWTHRKTIQKAIESFRLTSEQKDYLRTLR